MKGIKVLGIFIIVVILAGTTHLNSTGRSLGQSGTSLRASGRMCAASDGSICFDFGFTFDPAGGPVSGTYGGTVHWSDQGASFTGVAHGTLSGEFDGGDGGEVQGTLSGTSTTTGMGQTISQDVEGTWTGHLYGNGTGEGVSDAEGEGAWTVTFDGKAFQAALAPTAEPTSTTFTITGHEVKLSEMVQINITATPRIDDATKALLKQDSVMIVRDINGNFYAINNQKQAVQLPEAVRDVYDTCEKFTFLYNNGLLDKVGVTGGDEQINGGSQTGSLAKIPADLKDHDYTGLTTLCYGYGDHKCRSEMKINSTATSTHVIGGALGPSPSASVYCAEGSGASLVEAARLRSSEHGSIRGTINGGGCFIQVPYPGMDVETISLPRSVRSAPLQISNHPVYLGVQTVDTPDSAVVKLVQASSPAEQAGLQINDLVTRVDGTPIDSQNTLENLLGRYSPGEEVTLDVSRDGRAMTFKVSLASILPSVVITPSAEITVNDDTDLVIDIGYDGTTGVLVLADTAHVRERGSGAEADVAAGSLVVVLPGSGIKGPLKVNRTDYTAWWNGQLPAATPIPRSPTAVPRSGGSVFTLLSYGGCCLVLVALIVLGVVLLVARKKR